MNAKKARWLRQAARLVPLGPDYGLAPQRPGLKTLINQPETVRGTYRRLKRI